MELINETIKKEDKKLTFDEWLQHLSNNQNISSGNTQITNEADIIDKFLSNANTLERIKPTENENNTNLTKNLIQSEELEIISENLAQLYYKQGYYEKALKIYEKLYLKYPEKSIYFASLIQEIKEKINKN